MSKGLNGLAQLGITQFQFPLPDPYELNPTEERISGLDAMLYVPEYPGSSVPVTTPASAADATKATYATTPAGQAKALRDYLDEYAKQVALIKQGGFYDYGIGSSRRNVFYKGETGLQGLDGFWEQLTDDNKAIMTAAVIAVGLFLLYERSHL